MPRASWVAAAVLLAWAGGARAASVADGQAAYDAGQYDAARLIWTDAARTGDARAAYALATIYELGSGVAANPRAAFCWYRQAAASLPAAAFNVAVMQDSGRGAPHDPQEASRWYARAAASGHGRAEFNLAQLYDAGDGVPRNPALAASWFRAAAASGLPAAAERLASLRTPAPASASADDLPLAVTLDEPAVPSEPDRPVALTWAAPAQPYPVTYYVEVVDIAGTPPRDAFTASTTISAMLARLAPGRYAARVFAVAAERSHYAVGGWTAFAVGEPPPPAACP